jgi:hypothetical protein
MLQFVKLKELESKGGKRFVLEKPFDSSIERQVAEQLEHNVLLILDATPEAVHIAYQEQHKQTSSRQNSNTPPLHKHTHSSREVDNGIGTIQNKSIDHDQELV